MQGILTLKGWPLWSMEAIKHGLDHIHKQVNTKTVQTESKQDLDCIPHG